MPSEELELLLGFLKVIADESRLKLLGLLANGEHSVKEMAELLNLKEPTVSHHLAKLQEQEIVSMRPEGTAHYYRLNLDVLRQFRKELFSVEQVASLGDEVAGDAYERKVFRTFVEGETLVQMPTVRKKRDILLRWIAKDFEEGVEYSHKDVNAIIKKRHSDPTTLRREMIGLGLLKRERDTYWLLPG